MGPVLLSGDRITLREFTVDDLDVLHGIVSDERVTDWMAIDSLSRSQTAEWFDTLLDRAQEKPRMEFFLAVEADAEVVGFARLTRSDTQAADLGLAIGGDHWGKKYASDAAATAITYGFNTLGLHRVSAAVGPFNRASMAVVTRLGFVPEGRIRDHVHTNGAWRDSILYGLLAHEWPATSRE